MLIFQKCPYYRDSENLSMGKGLGHCDLGGEAICEGILNFVTGPMILTNSCPTKRRKKMI